MISDRLRNRRYFDERLQKMEASAEASASVSLLVIDIDEFKAINDLQGHVVGDDVLRWVASFLTANLRVHDVCCRTGGDEFMVILTHADRQKCQQAIGRIKRSLRRAQADSPFDFEILLSVGSSTWPDDGSTSKALIQCADEAMYRDKKSRPRSYPNLYPVSQQHQPLSLPRCGACAGLHLRRSESLVGPDTRPPTFFSKILTDRRSPGTVVSCICLHHLHMRT